MAAAEQQFNPETTLGSKMANIFVAPSDVFDELKSSPPRTSNWLVPMVISIIAGIIYIMIMYSQPAIIQQMRQPMEQSFAKLVKQGKMTQQAADQQLEKYEQLMSPSFLRVMGILSVLFISPAFLFFVAMLLWLVGTFVFHGHFDFMKAVEAVGLSSMISVLGAAIAVPMLILSGNLAMNLGPVLMISHFDPTNPVHIVLSSLNLMTMWYLAVVAIALARLSGVHFIKAALWPFGLWFLLLVARVGLVVLMKKING
jgi:Yip1 domain